MVAETFKKSKAITRCAGDVNHYLLNALKEHDCAAYLHSCRVAKISLFLGQQIKLGKKEIEHLTIAALLHDIGKIKLPLNTLQKTQSLDATEWQEIHKHSQYGASILAKYSAVFTKDIIDCVRHHHERYSGNGYPDKLKGESIPLYARVVAIADAIDAMTNSRPYRPIPLLLDEALSEIQIHSGTQFDPHIVKTFIRKNL